MDVESEGEIKIPLDTTVEKLYLRGRFELFEGTVQYLQIHFLIPEISDFGFPFFTIITLFKEANYH